MNEVSTPGGTTFKIDGEQVIISKADQPTCTIPMDDLREFFALYLSTEEPENALWHFSAGALPLLREPEEGTSGG